MRNRELMAIKSLQSLTGASSSGRAGLHLNTDTGLIKGSQLAKPLGELQPHPTQPWTLPGVEHPQFFWARAGWAESNPLVTPLTSVLYLVELGLLLHEVQQSWSNRWMQQCYKACDKCKVFCELACTPLSGKENSDDTTADLRSQNSYSPRAALIEVSIYS